jgi:DNA-binding MarR family transcriptional regulator
MCLKCDADSVVEDHVRRFMIAFFALHRYITTQSPHLIPPQFSPTQIRLLHLISHKPGLSQKLIADHLGVTTASISTSVRDLETQGIIERESDPQDARVMLLRLAPGGEQIFAQIFGTFMNTFAGLLGALSCGEQTELVTHFEALLTANQIPLDRGNLSC